MVKLLSVRTPFTRPNFIEHRVIPIQDKITNFNWNKLKDSIRLKLSGYSNEKDIQLLLEEFQKYLFIKIIEEDLDATSFSELLN